MDLNRRLLFAALLFLVAIFLAFARKIPVELRGVFFLFITVLGIALILAASRLGVIH